MGEYLRETQRRLSRSDRQPGRLARVGLSGLVLLLGGLGLALVVAGIVRQSGVALGGGVLVLVAGLLWRASDRTKPDPEDPAVRPPAEVRLAAASMVAVLVGIFGWLLGMIKGW